MLSGPQGPLFLSSGAKRQHPINRPPIARPPERQFRGRVGTQLSASTQPKEELAAGTQCLLGWGHALVYGKPGPQPNKLSVGCWPGIKVDSGRSPASQPPPMVLGLESASFRRSRPPDFRLSKTNPKNQCPYSAFATSDRVLTQPGRSQRALSFLTNPLRWALWPAGLSPGSAKVLIEAAAGPPEELTVSQTGHPGRHLGGSDVSIDLCRRQTPMT